MNALSCWFYKLTETRMRVYTVGYYDPNGHFQPESDHGTKEEAARRVHYLNGGNDDQCPVALKLVAQREAARDDVVRMTQTIDRELTT
jgi:hypothetical protein